MTFHRSRNRGVVFALCLSLALLLATGVPALHAATAPSALAQSTGVPQTTDDANAPRDCIDPLMASHIAATLISLLPLPGWADAADVAAYALNIALKQCPPDLTAPPDIVVQQPNQGCLHRLTLPTPADMAALIAMDRAIIEEVLVDPALNLTPSQRAELMTELSNTFGRFANYAYGSYTNIYGFALPIAVTSLDAPYWGAFGTPNVFHYNSDVLIEMNYPGQRISASTLEVPVGNHVVIWEANTTISEFDYIPFFVATSAYRAYRAAQAQATKRFAIDGTKAALKKTIEQMLREGNRFFAKQVAKEIAREVIIEATLVAAEQLYEASPYYSGGDFTGAKTVALQKLTIIDTNAPTISGAQPVIFEATDPGGMQAARKLNELQAQIVVSDNCDPDPSLTYSTPRFWPLLLDDSGNPLPSAEIKWRASDNGAASALGGVNTTEVAQQITIVDTTPPLLLAPPPVMMYTQPGGVEVPLGNAQSFDIVDLRPTVEYNAPGTTPGVRWPIFNTGVHFVQWTAIDQSGNVSQPDAQLVNIKAPGTNNPPVAFSQTGGETVQAVADVPIKITVRGEDQDVDGAGMRDPIWFGIDQQPDNGFFIAPLYPYFVDDYRITARYSPQIAAVEGEAFALTLAQDPNEMRDYIIDLCEIDKERRDLPRDFVYFQGGNQKYLAVDDDGYTYIYDQFYDRCHAGGGTISPMTTPRISVWDPNGIFVGQQERSDSGQPLRDVKFDISRGYIISTQSDGSTTGTSLVNLSRIQPVDPNEPIVDVESYRLWADINTVYVGLANTARSPEIKNAGTAVWDHNMGILYVVGDPQHNSVGMTAFQAAPCDSDPGGAPDACLNFIGSQVWSSPLIQSTKWDEFPGLGVDAMKLQRIGDIALDSEGYVYILATPAGGNFDRIYKFAAPTQNPDGTISLGEFIGWMGKCDTGPDCNYIEHRSIGYSCTDLTCAVDSSTAGSLPGQFDNAGAIAMDRNDILYVADSGNKRVQRFSPDGLFAGEARSQDACQDCTGFVLGDFGAPGNIAVNASHFYILDIDEELVHIFEASVVHSIDDASAWVEYQSKSNYVGPDQFTFRATDGFLTDAGELIESAPATVALNVARNFRPPIADDGFASTLEDVAVAITLVGYDLDRELDTLTYAISFAPQHGTLSGSPPNVTYHPLENFAGTDTFQFTVSDGQSTSEPASVTVEVTPQNDAPQVIPDAASLKSGLGHAFTLHALVLDPDVGDTLTAKVDWGDGTVETSGDLAMDGGMSKLSLTPLVDGRSDLLGYHTYASAGTYTIHIEVTDAASAIGTAQVQVTVEPMADLDLQRAAKSYSPSTSQQYSYELTVTNQPASGGQGIAASSVSLSEILTGSATYGAAIPSTGSCDVSSHSINCNLGSLNVGQVAKITIQLQMGGNASAGTVITLDGNAGSATPDPILANNRDRFDLAVVPVGDFYVDSFRDGADAAPGDGTCATANGECTARAAIMEANALAGAQIVVFGYGVHVLESTPATAGEAAINESAGDLDINGDITLLGIGAQKSILHANATDRVLEIHGGTVRIESMAITGGNAGESGEGGGIRINGGDVQVRRVAIDSNQAMNGGGVMVAGGSMRIAESSLSSNNATASGGGIMNQAQLTIENTTISGNQADSGGGLMATGGSAQLLYVTVAGNSAGAGGGVNTPNNSVRIQNTLLAGNDAPVGPDCTTGLTSDGRNLIGSLSNCAVGGDTGDNVINQPPRIDVLTGNPAETYSHPLLTGSPAIGRASCLVGIDQTGAQRPTEGGCDIGAYETNAMGAGVYMPIVGKE